MNGSMAIGSRRTTPTAPVAAAVVSLLVVAPRKTPCAQSRASVTSGTTALRRPPNRIASIGTPFGSKYSLASRSQFSIGVQNRLFGCELTTPDSGVQSLPFQSVRCAGACLVMPSHQTSPSSVSATLVKMLPPFSTARIAAGLVEAPVPGATPNRPASGFWAYSRPSGPKCIQQMSSPIISAVQPGTVGSIIAMLVLPQALGKAAAT